MGLKELETTKKIADQSRLVSGILFLGSIGGITAIELLGKQEFLAIDLILLVSSASISTTLSLLIARIDKRIENITNGN